MNDSCQRDREKSSKETAERIAYEHSQDRLQGMNAHGKTVDTRAKDIRYNLLENHEPDDQSGSRQGRREKQGDHRGRNDRDHGPDDWDRFEQERHDADEQWVGHAKR